MKNGITIFLSLLLFCSSFFPHFDLEEISKIPVLMQHYSEHRKEAAHGLTFIDFLVMHYHSDHAKKDDHSSLPLIKHQCAGMAFVIPSAVKFKSVPIFHHPQHSTEVLLHYFFLNVHSLLQPPKLA